MFSAALAAHADPMSELYGFWSAYDFRRKPPAVRAAYMQGIHDILDQLHHGGSVKTRPKGTGATSLRGTGPARPDAGATRGPVIADSPEYPLDL